MDALDCFIFFWITQQMLLNSRYIAHTITVIPSSASYVNLVPDLASKCSTTRIFFRLLTQHSFYIRTLLPLKPTTTSGPISTSVYPAKSTTTFQSASANRYHPKPTSIYQAKFVGTCHSESNSSYRRKSTSVYSKNMVLTTSQFTTSTFSRIGWVLALRPEARITVTFSQTTPLLPHRLPT